jgi:hypothetical protein
VLTILPSCTDCLEILRASNCWSPKDLSRPALLLTLPDDVRISRPKHVVVFCYSDTAIDIDLTNTKGGCYINCQRN